ncbi:LytR/AlgR family response regulator transcription factor [Jiulongibacter sediminis]|uniref:HTH LytTR-type domain-containing protein n=1 Tax=Jiulongibacter sediminis TaxID=1605367 RepID=A0A0N8H9H8_9BACT|nr:LytTR family DNA-binding domain-containing protein [Jiulongibacter sediminis]KPM47412.1 hypothetical protein AFM12_14765 [Jiulongibacter sediminis]TBX22992.1 hypothetical protein TK44_14775 [Jiulongibacter sediminis]
MKTEIHIGGRITLPEEEIILLEGHINYTNVYTKSGDIHIVATTLKLLENRVSDRFYRSHKKYIVNLKEIEEYGQTNIRLKNQKQALISRRRRQGLVMELNKIELKKAGII